MGIDLRLLPFDWYREGTGYSHTVLNLPRNYEMHEEIRALWSREILESDQISSIVGGSVPDGESEGETCYGNLIEDSYGNPYHYVRAPELARILSFYFPNHPSTAYVRAMKQDEFVILDWT